MNSQDNDLFDGLKAVVQYRRKDDGHWHSMAAFDIEHVADKYAKDCSSKNTPWEYRVVPVVDIEIEV